MKTVFLLILSLLLLGCRTVKDSTTSQRSEVIHEVQKDTSVTLRGNTVGVNLDYQRISRMMDSLMKSGQKPEIIIPPAVGGKTTLRLIGLPNGQIRAECATEDSIFRWMMKYRDRQVFASENRHVVEYKMPRWGWYAIGLLFTMIFLFLAFIIYSLKRQVSPI